MLDISVGCTNEDTYGVSCHMCGDCGRKFTVNGVDDSEVVDKKAKIYKNLLDSEEWKGLYFNSKDQQVVRDAALTDNIGENRTIMSITSDTKKRICSCCAFYSQPTYVACRHCRGFDKFECKYEKFGMNTTIVSTKDDITVTLKMEENE